LDQTNHEGSAVGGMDLWQSGRETGQDKRWPGAAAWGEQDYPGATLNEGVVYQGNTA